MSTPRLPDAPPAYSAGFMSQLLGSLRAYFVQLEAVRHINVASININLDTLPTTSVGQRDGDVWVDGNILKVTGLAGGGGGSTTTNPVTFNNSGSGAASGTSFDGSAAVTVSYNTVGAAAASHTHPWSQITSTPTTLAGYGITDFTTVGDGYYLRLSGGTLYGPLLIAPTYAGDPLTITAYDDGDMAAVVTTGTNTTGVRVANASISGAFGVDATGIFVQSNTAYPFTIRTDFTDRVVVSAAGALTLNAPGSGAHSLQGPLNFTQTPTVGGVAVSLVGHTHSYQPLDADLTAIAALSGTSGFLKKTAADTWTLDTNTYSTTSHNHDGTYATAGHNHDSTYLGIAYKEVQQNSQSANYTLVLTDSAKHILHPSADTTARTFTIPANASVAFPIGTAITFVNQNGAGVVTIAITSDTMRLSPDGTTGSRTLAANGMATALKITATEWIISGTGLT